MKRALLLILLAPALAAATVLTVPLTNANIHAIATEGKAVLTGGLDSEGDAYSGTQLGPIVTAGGNTFTLGAPDVLDAVSNVTVALPAGSYTQLAFVGTGYNGAQTGQTFTVTYTDGTTTVLTQSLSDWWVPKNYPGESLAMATTHRVAPSGAVATGTFSLYAYSIALDKTKVPKSLKLPANRNVAVLAIDLVVAAPPVIPPTVKDYEFGWGAPASNNDGSPITDLTAYLLSNSQSSIGPFLNWTMVAANITTYTFKGLPTSEPQCFAIAGFSASNGAGQPLVFCEPAATTSPAAPVKTP